MSINPRQMLRDNLSQRSPIPPEPEPLVDPRSQAMQQYMEMMGAERQPNLPRMPYRQVPNALDDMQKGSMDAYSNDPDMYFRDLDSNDSHYDFALDDELNLQEPRMPTYINHKGKPSPNEEYEDEGILEELARRIGDQ